MAVRVKFWVKIGGGHVIMCTEIEQVSITVVNKQSVTTDVILKN
jgi:hypothetical protein